MDYFATEYETTGLQGGVCAVLEDSIMQKGRLVTSGSKILENFVSPIDATVVTRLEEAGVTILGKTKMDEFGAAGLFKDAEPFASGAVTAVVDGTASFALCNDFSGVVRMQAAAKGVCYIHPTYGTVSRYGLIQAVPSMDQIGIVCKTPADGFRALSIIAGHNPKDGAMFPDVSRGALRIENGEFGIENGALRIENGEKHDSVDVTDAAATTGGTPLRIGVPVNILAVIHDNGVLGAVREFAACFKTVEFELEHFDFYTQVMQILCCAELSSSLCRYDGIKFGYRADGYNNLHELYAKSRTDAFGAHVKLAAMTGAMVLTHDMYDKYYDKAMRIRRLIKDSLSFDKYDALIIPTQPAEVGVALHALPQLCGLPSVTFPFRSTGLTLIASARHEDVLRRLKGDGYNDV